MLMLLAKAIGSGLVVQSGISCSRVAGVGHKVPNAGVTSVKVKAPCPEEDEQEPDAPPQEPEAPVAACGDYTEGRIDNADYPGLGKAINTEVGAQAACNADATCKGYWQRFGGAEWHLLLPGSRSWAQGVPNAGVTSVKVKAPCPEVQDEAEAVGDPHMMLTSGQKLDLCCEGGKCEPCNSLHDRNNDEQGRPRHPHHRRCEANEPSLQPVAMVSLTM